jgi:hypothetical protein
MKIGYDTVYICNSVIYTWFSAITCICNNTVSIRSNFRCFMKRPPKSVTITSLGILRKSSRIGSDTKRLYEGMQSRHNRTGRPRKKFKYSIKRCIISLQRPIVQVLPMGLSTRLIPILPILPLGRSLQPRLQNTPSATLQLLPLSQTLSMNPLTARLRQKPWQKLSKSLSTTLLLQGRLPIPIPSISLSATVL